MNPDSARTLFFFMLMVLFEESLDEEGISGAEGDVADTEIGRMAGGELLGKGDDRFFGRIVDDGGSGAGEGSCSCFANAARSTGDEGYAAVQSKRVFIFPMVAFSPQNMDSEKWCEISTIKVARVPPRGWFIEIVAILN